MIPTGVRIFVCTAPVDMRYGFDRLAQLARERVGQDPVEGGVINDNYFCRSCCLTGGKQCTTRQLPTSHQQSGNTSQKVFTEHRSAGHESTEKSPHETFLGVPLHRYQWQPKVRFPFISCTNATA